MNLQAPPLRFHWSMSRADDTLRGAKARAHQSGRPDLDAYVAFCHHAEACGIETLLTAFGFHRPDPIAMAAALGMVTKHIAFMVAVRSGICSPTAFVQQVNTVSALTNGRICINVVGGHTPAEQRAYGDFLAHDERYARTDEFLTICRALWETDDPVTFKGTYYHIENGTINTPFVSDTRRAPEIFLGGASPAALDLAARHAACLWTLPKTPDVLQPRIAPVLESGTEVGLLLSIIARPTREEAIHAAYAVLDAVGTQALKTHQDFARRSDSVAFTATLAMAEANTSDWLTPYLWTGAVPFMGAPAIALVGSFEEMAEALMIYKGIGITQFLLMGWPDLEEMTLFSREVLPRVRHLEQDAESASLHLANPDTANHA